MGAKRRNGMKRHAIRRADERWGARLNLEDIGSLNVLIRMGLGRPIASRSRRHGRKLWITTLDWVRLPVVYDDRVNTIVTVLPPHAKELQRYMAKLA